MLDFNRTIEKATIRYSDRKHISGSLGQWMGGLTAQENKGTFVGWL